MVFSQAQADSAAIRSAQPGHELALYVVQHLRLLLPCSQQTNQWLFPSAPFHSKAFLQMHARRNMQVASAVWEEVCAMLGRASRGRGARSEGECGAGTSSCCCGTVGTCLTPCNHHAQHKALDNIVREPAHVARAAEAMMTHAWPPQSQKWLTMSLMKRSLSSWEANSAVSQRLAPKACAVMGAA